MPTQREFRIFSQQDVVLVGKAGREILIFPTERGAAPKGIPSGPVAHLSRSDPFGTWGARQMGDMPFFFYVIRSKVDGSFYRGHAEDLAYRIKKHNNGESRSTKGKRPWELVYSEGFASRSEAFKREQLLKSPKRLERMAED